MCKFCEEQVRLTTNFPKDNKYGELDSSEMIMLSGGVIRILNPNGRGSILNQSELPIFQIDVLYCPYCGRRLKEETTLTKYNDKTIFKL